MRPAASCRSWIRSEDCWRPWRSSSTGFSASWRSWTASERTVSRESTASPSVDEAFKSVYRTLLDLQRAVVREEISGTARFLEGNRPEKRGHARNRGKDAL